jgi:hypothetical protein
MNIRELRPSFGLSFFFQFILKSNLHLSIYTFQQISTMAINGTNGHAQSAVTPINYEEVESKGMLAYRAPSLLQPHRMREAIKDAHDGKIRPLLSYFMVLSCPPMVKVVAQFGYDVITLDWEHSACNVETMNQVRHSQTCSTSKPD